MPEGDTILRAAPTLNRALAGHQVVRFESVLPALTRIHEDAPITGRSVESVTAAGKHVLMKFSGGLVLRTHMRMNGSWHIYRPGERWRRSRHDMRVVVATEKFEAVGFNIPVAEFLQGRALERQPDLRLMGPDLLGETFDQDEAVRRLRERDRTEIAEARGGGHRQRLQVGSAVPLPCESADAGPLAERRTAARDPGGGADAPAGERCRSLRGDRDVSGLPADAGQCKSCGRVVCLRTRRPAVPEVRHVHREGGAGRARPAHVLVSHLPAVTCGAPLPASA
jgi:hypothetical protein